MSTPLFITGLAAVIFTLIAWGARSLPRENRQFFAVLPLNKDQHNQWTGLNLTWYGLLSANAYTFSVVIFLILGRSAQIPVLDLGILVSAMLAVCLPASRLLARWVEKKKNTLTVGGAVFVGTLAAPWLVQLHGALNPQSAPVSPGVFMAALATAYAFGEGLGRLACVSFGCCYGRPLSQCPPWVNALFSRFHLIFSGETKKIAYADDLTGKKVIPVQIITAVIYSVTGLSAAALFLSGRFIAALFLSIFVTQVWRFVSEFLRADFRGDFTVTPYQIMALVSLCYTLTIPTLFPVTTGGPPQLGLGLSALWNPAVLLFIQAVWLVCFFHTGRSSVTGATLFFHVRQDRI